MRIKLLTLLCILCAVTAHAAEPSYNFAQIPLYTGSSLLLNDTVQITDGVPVRTKIIHTRRITDLHVDVISDKGMTVDIIRLPDYDNEAKPFLSYTQSVIPDGGGVVGPWIEKIGCAKAKIVITKTEAGDTSTYQLVVSGGGN